MKLLPLVLVICAPALAAAAPTPAPTPAPAAAAAAPAPPVTITTPVTVTTTAGTPIAATTAPPTAPTFEVRDRGDAVEVIGHHLKAARTGITPVRSRLEIPLVGHPFAPRALSADPTVKSIELDGEGTRSISVKLGFERADVKTLARFAQAIQVGDDLHVLIPRRVPAAGTAVQLPEPTLPPELAHDLAHAPPTIVPTLTPTPTAPIAVATAATKPVENPGEKAIAPAVDQALATKTAAKDAPKVAALAADGASDKPAATLIGKAVETTSVLAGPATEPPPAPPVAPALPESTSARQPSSTPAAPTIAANDGAGSWSKVSMYGIAGLAAAGCGIWLLRRRRGAQAAGSTIEVIAQRSLGGKARVIWLAAGSREMVVSVTPQQVRMLGQWRKQEQPVGLPHAYTHADAHTDSRADSFAEARTDLRPDLRADLRPDLRPEPRVERPTSSAVSGILRLRERAQSIPPVNDEVATGDPEADMLWAREILHATGGRR